ncbi:MAG: S8 family serine peptidase [Symploca sp. SIO3C6]|nr:S8 family serine peptidase [Symploca sp. SIO3C6]NET07149.1 S8 family serine peptidase [Symploca sp. SIO2B6]NET50167.1 S8 family serine peptidase [Merismopedia sp. SIO2A8]
MKWHVRLKLERPPVNDGAIPHWQKLIADQSLVKTRLHPDVDAVFSRHQLPFWVTKEYDSAERQWSRSECDCGLDRIYRLILQSHRKVLPTVLQELSQLPIVESAAMGDIGYADLPELQPMQMSVTTGARSRLVIGVPDAHQLFTTGSPSITIAVLDTGVDLNHPELSEVLLPGYDFVDIINGAGKFVGDFLGFDEDPEDEVGHGTHVAGIIAAKGDRMPPGVVPQCRILPVRVLGAMKKGNKRIGSGLIDNINVGIKWAIDRGADVINMSLGVKSTGGGLPHQEVVDYAQRQGVTLVAASGNDGKEESYYPGALPHVITVGAIDELNKVAPFSTYGKQVDFVAPGTDIYSTYIKDDYAFSTGTSHAAPFVSGAVALLKSYALIKKGINLRDQQIKYLLQQTADKFDQRFKHRKAGFGKLNLLDALRLLDYKLR